MPIAAYPPLGWDHTEPAGLSTGGPAFNPQVRVISARATFVPERAENYGHQPSLKDNANDR